MADTKAKSKRGKPAEMPQPQNTEEHRALSAELTTDEQVAERAGVSVATLRRWVKAGAIPQYQGKWTTAAVAHARIVSQLRRGGQPLDEIVKAAQDGRLALGSVNELFVVESETYTLKKAAKEAGIKLAVAEQIWLSLGLSVQTTDQVTRQDVEALKRIAAVLEAGVPLGALLQVIRVAAKSFADIADAEARLVRMFVHEPLLQEGAKSDEISEVMGAMIQAVLPHMSPLFEYMHMRFLQQYTEQVQIENVQGAPSRGRSIDGKLNVTICFVDIAGFTRYTEQAGVEKAFEQADQLRQHIDGTLPDSARLIKLTGDGAMIVGSEPGELVRWAVELADEEDKIFDLRIGMDFGEALYRDGDYFGGAINMAARVLNRADANEALATEQLKDQIKNRAAAGLRFVSIGTVRLKGFDETVELFRVEARER
ncbi:MAG: adenylate cyclase regulatory domain-containing protein [Solirubrobacterales bacterium]